MTQIKLRRDTSAAFASSNPILGNGEPAYETDTKKLKIGDGTTAYTQLEYFSAGGGGSTNISATLPLKIVDGVISLDVDGQTIQIVDGKLHANLDELGNKVNSLTGEVTDLSGRVTAAEADILTKENKITTTGALSLQEKIKTNAVGFTVASESAMTNDYYQRVPFPESKSSRLYIADTSFTYPYKSYLAIPYSLGQVIRVPRAYGQLFFGSFDDNGDFIVSIGFNTFYYDTNGFALFGGPVYRAVTGSSEYPPVMPRLNPTQMGYDGNYTYHTPPREAADSGDLYGLSDYLPENDFSCAFYQISPDTTGAIMIQAFWSMKTGRCSTAVYRDTEASYQYAGHLDAMRDNIQYALWLPNETGTSYNPSKFGLYDWNVSRIPWSNDSGWKAFFEGRGPNLYSLTGQSSKNYLELNLGDGLSVVDGKLTASSTAPSNMVTTDTAQTISGQKEFNRAILFLGNGDLIRGQQSSSYRNGAGLSMGPNTTSTDGGVFAPQWKIYDTAGGVERTETIITTYNQSELNSSNFNTANKLVRLDSDGKLPAVDGSNLTNLPGGGSAPANMVTTDTAQTISGDKEFTGITTISNDIKIPIGKKITTPDGQWLMQIGTGFIGIGTSMRPLQTYDGSNYYLHNKSVIAGDGIKITEPSSGEIQISSTIGNMAAYVTEEYVNGTEGYRVWSNGRCEQWGRYSLDSSTGEQHLTFLKEYKDTNYLVLIAKTSTDASAWNVMLGLTSNWSTSGLVIKANLTGYTLRGPWYVSGILAS